MKMMYNFLKENFKERLWRNPEDVAEFQEDVTNFLLEGKIKKYNETFKRNYTRYLRC
jgi:hypothetical protein